ncbi:MAG: lysine 2,3-aminomutase [Acidobacteria bacterium]|nr:lysine 2,3-aminomutase [Acidobacteriota bacterium]
MTKRDRSSYRAIGRHHLATIPQLERLKHDQRLALEAVSAVFPFRVNQYVVDELIDWDDIPNDPIYQLTFPQAGMLSPADLQRMVECVRGRDRLQLAAEARKIQMRLNPHPAGQLELNVPEIDGRRLPGAQHKYRETLLFFPSQGQTCHAYCTYCFRWPQFVGIRNLKFAAAEMETLARYLGAHTEVTDVLFTGGDPLIMSTKVLRSYIEPLLAPEFVHVANIRIGTKSISFWPLRFISDPDADDLLRLFSEVRRRGRQLAVMAHVSHPRELKTPAAQEAIRRIRSAGAEIRCQSPLIRHINDDADTCANLWQSQVRLGAIPYYIFVERDTGPRHYFQVPLARALKIFSEAYSRVSGLARTVRGPTMSTTPGKVLVAGTTDIGGDRAFVLKVIQGRDPSWVNRIFFAKFDAQAAWLNDLEPFFPGREFFFAEPLRQMRRGLWAPPWAIDADLEQSAPALA